MLLLIIRIKTAFSIHKSKNVILGHLNINPLRNKFELLRPFIYGTFDIFDISETKINSSFRNSKFRLAQYKIFRHERDSFGEYLGMYVNERIPVKPFF